MAAERPGPKFEYEVDILGQVTTRVAQEPQVDREQRESDRVEDWMIDPDVVPPPLPIYAQIIGLICVGATTAVVLPIVGAVELKDKLGRFFSGKVQIKEGPMPEDPKTA